MTLRRSRDDRGTMLPLVIGLVVVLLGLVAVVTDVSALWLQRRSLQVAADGAALAGAQAVDLSTYYRDGAPSGQDLALAPAQVRNAVRRYARDAGLAARIPGYSLVSVATKGNSVTVSMRARMRPPFAAFLTGREVDVVAAATAVTRTDP